MRRIIAATLFVCLTGCAGMQQQGAAPAGPIGVPPDSLVVKRKELGNALLMQLQTYQLLRPMATWACEAKRIPPQECFNIASGDEKLRGVWNQWWEALFTWSPEPERKGFDWGNLFSTLLDLVAGLAKYAPLLLAAPPGMDPRHPGIMPQMPQMQPQPQFYPGAVPGVPQMIMPPVPNQPEQPKKQGRHGDPTEMQVAIDLERAVRTALIGCRGFTCAGVAVR